MSLGLLLKNESSTLVFSDRIVMYDKLYSSISSKYLDVGQYRVVSVGRDFDYIEDAFKAIEKAGPETASAIADVAIAATAARENDAISQEKAQRKLRKQKNNSDDKIQLKQPSFLIAGARESMLVINLTRTSINDSMYAIGESDLAYNHLLPTIPWKRDTPTMNLMLAGMSAMVESTKLTRVRGIPDVRILGEDEMILEEESSAALYNLAGAYLLRLVSHDATVRSYHRALNGDISAALKQLTKIGESENAMTTTAQTFDQWVQRTRSPRYSKNRV